MRQRNEKFAKDARSGKKPTHLSRQEKLAKRSPVNIWILGVIVFVVVGGGTLPSICLFQRTNNLLHSTLRVGEASIPVTKRTPEHNVILSFLFGPERIVHHHGFILY